MSDEFEIITPVVRSEGIGVPVNEIQRAINVICQQMQQYLNEIASGGFPLTNVDITGGTIAGVAISNSTGRAPTERIVPCKSDGMSGSASFTAIWLKPQLRHNISISATAPALSGRPTDRTA